jgi:hypothetical protein
MIESVIIGPLKELERRRQEVNKVAKEILVEGLNNRVLLKETHEMALDDISTLVIFPYPRKEMMLEMQKNMPIELLIEGNEIDTENDLDVIEVVTELDKVHVSMLEIREVCLTRRRQMMEQGKQVSDETFDRIVFEAISNTFPQLNEILPVLGAIGRGVVGAARAVGSAAVAGVKAVGKGVDVAAKWAAKNIGPMAKKAWGVIKDIGLEGWKGIKKVAGESWEVIKNLSDKLVPTAKKAWAATKNVVSKGRDAIAKSWGEISPDLKKLSDGLKGKAGDLANNFKAMEKKAPQTMQKAMRDSGLHPKDMSKVKAQLADPAALSKMISGASAAGDKPDPEALQFAMMLPFMMMMMTMMTAQHAQTGQGQLAAGRKISKRRVQQIINEEVKKQFYTING